jgi:glycosyltransferase involved in cell wall biosynthesis
MIKKVPRVSIITVVYNGDAYLEQTIRSVAEQDYPNLEYIIIDGGSTDRTLDIIHRNKAHIDYWVSEADEGIYDAMNKGIAHATGDVIGLINADDWYEPGIVEWVVDVMEISGVDVVHGGMNILQEKEEVLVKPAPQDLGGLSRGMLLNHPAVFAKASLYRKYGLFDLDYPIAADWEMMVRWWLNSVEFYADEKVFVNFRMGGASSVGLRKSFEEKHRIRKKHRLYTGLDLFYLYDRMKCMIPEETLLKISLKKQTRHKRC